MALRDDILHSTDIVDLVSRYVQLKKVGKNRVGLCPFHKENSPSFTVAEDKQIFKCFGCGKGGNAITFHMEIEKIDFWDSAQILAKDANIDVSKYQKDPEEMSKQQGEREKIKLLNKRTQSFFSDHFTTESLASTYIREKRKLTDETIKAFGIGYAPDSHYDLVNKLKDKGFSADDMMQAGLARKGQQGDLYAFFRQRVTFPIVDHVGNIVGFGARALEKDQTPKYLNTTETPLYDKSKVLYGLDKARLHLSELGFLIIVEGYMDVIALHQYGLPVGIATCGTALTTQHTKLIRRHTDQLVFAFDNDQAGFDATIRGLKVAYQQDLFPKILHFPTDYKDVDEWLSNTEIDLSDPSRRLKEHSSDGFTWVLQTLARTMDLQNPVERKKVLNTCFELLANIEDWTILTLYIDQMSARFATGTDSLLKQFKGFLKQQRKSNFQSAQPKEKKHQLDPKYLLASLWYKDFLSSLQATTDPLQNHLSLIEELSNHFPHSLVNKVRNDQIDDEEKQTLLEAHLRWEKQCDGMKESVRTATLQRFLHSHLHTLERVLLKSDKLSDEEKQELMKKMKQLNR